MKDNIIQATVSVAIGALISYFNILFIPILVLIAVMLIDYITGLTSAYRNGELKSKTGLIGILKKKLSRSCGCCGCCRLFNLHRLSGGKCRYRCHILLRFNCNDLAHHQRINLNSRKSLGVRHANSEIPCKYRPPIEKYS